MSKQSNANEIVVSYRRGDSMDITSRIVEHLCRRFGRSQVFWDIQSIPAGADFRAIVNNAFSDCRIALVIIGPQWLGNLFDGSTRIMQADDWVRTEVRHILAHSIPLIPVLVNRADMPCEEALPPDIQKLAFLQFVQVDSGLDFPAQMHRLCGEIEGQLARAASADWYSLAVGQTLSLMDPYRMSNSGFEMRHIETSAELRELYAIDSEAYGDASLSFDRFQEWWCAHTAGLYAMVHSNRVLGAVGIWPITTEWANALKMGKTREASLTDEEIKSAKAMPCANWYVSGIVLRPDSRQIFNAGFLIRHALVTWALEEDISYPVSLIALAYSAMGEKLLVRFGFKIVMPAARALDGFPVYEKQLQRRELNSLLKQLQEF